MHSHSSPFLSDTEDNQKSRAVLERFGCVFRPPVMGRGTLPPVEALKRYGKPFAEFCVRTLERGGAWCDDITEDEAAALIEHGRGGLDRMRTAADFNSVNRPGARGVMGHDAINRHILIEERLKRLGIPKDCPTCEGHGAIFTGPAYLSLVLWVLHPRKGCSRGWEVKNIQQAELPEIYAYLRLAAQRNAERFSRIPAEGRSE